MHILYICKCKCIYIYIFLYTYLLTECLDVYISTYIHMNII